MNLLDFGIARAFLDCSMVVIMGIRLTNIDREGGLTSSTKPVQWHNQQYILCTYRVTVDESKSTCRVLIDMVIRNQRMSDCSGLVLKRP
jgi:hypothetical protein